MKILAICGDIDLRIMPSTNTILWQLFRALHDAGNELIIVPNRGDPVETPWWTSCDSPNRTWIEIYNTLRPFKPTSRNSNATQLGGRGGLVLDRFQRRLGGAVVEPSWRRRLWPLLSQGHVDAVISFGVGLIHLKKLFRDIRRSFHVPILYYDVETPNNLPMYYPSSPYIGFDPTEFDALIVVSAGAAEFLMRSGAPRVHTVYCAADPELFKPVDREKDVDVLFPGWGNWERAEAIEEMVTYPASQMRGTNFAVLGALKEAQGRIRGLPPVPFSEYPRECSRAKITLNIARRPVVETYASSNSRLFELAASGACIVTNECAGLREFFEPGKEIHVAKNRNQAIELYEWLLSDDNARVQTGDAARARVVRDHSYVHRAVQLGNIIESLTRGL